jgi:Skp family chaperone for outer membrane proteins
MSTLNAFSEKERDYHRYQSRREALRVQRAVAQELEERRAAEQAALQAVEVERQAKEAALAEIARLKALLERQTKG